VKAHQKERGHGWKTVEAPLELTQAIATHTAADTVVLVDCLTLWVSNLMMETDAREAQAYTSKIRQLVRSLKTVHGPIVLVSNEVGTGIVPENQMARLFRDVVGTLNQEIARAATTVFWMVAGIPVKIKACS
jgi:adenosylcobinamide kinase/adenosylcobinamide-phosphate guanylyltransferase